MTAPQTGGLSESERQIDEKKKKELQCPKKIVSQVNILTLLILMLF